MFKGMCECDKCVRKRRILKNTNRLVEFGGIAQSPHWTGLLQPRAVTIPMCAGVSGQSIHPQTGRVRPTSLCCPEANFRLCLAQSAHQLPRRQLPALF